MGKDVLLSWSRGSVPPTPYYHFRKYTRLTSVLLRDNEGQIVSQGGDIGQRNVPEGVGSFMLAGLPSIGERWVTPAVPECCDNGTH